MVYLGIMELMALVGQQVHQVVMELMENQWNLMGDNTDPLREVFFMSLLLGMMLKLLTLLLHLPLMMVSLNLINKF